MMIRLLFLSLLIFSSGCAFMKYPYAPFTDDIHFYGSDSNKIIFNYYQPVHHSDWTKHICGLGVYDYEKQSLIQLLPSQQGTCLKDPYVSYDQQWITFAYQDLSIAKEDFRQQIGIMRTDGSDFQLLTDTATFKGSPSFSWDGKKIIYRASHHNHDRNRLSWWDVWEVDVATKKETQLTNLSAYALSRPMYLPDGKHFAVSPDINQFDTYVQYKKKYQVGMTKKRLFFPPKPIMRYEMFDGSDISASEYNALRRAEENHQKLTPYEQQYGKNALFIQSIKGDQRDKQEHDFSQPYVNFFDATKLDTKRMARDVERYGGPPYPWIDKDNLYYINFVGINQAGDKVILRGGGEYRQQNIFRYHLKTKTLEQLTENPSSTAMSSPVSSLDGKRAFFVLERAIPSYQKNQPNYYKPLLLDIPNKKIALLNTDTILKQVSQQLKTRGQAFVPWKTKP